MYDPNMMRFTARDPIRGKYNNPMTFHVYLYCQNDPMNYTDISGESMLVDVTQSSGLRAFLFNSLTSAIRGNDLKTSVLHGALGVLGAGAGKMMFASFSQMSIFTQSLQPYSEQIAKIVANGIGGGMATIAAHYGQPGEQNWNDARFLADLGGSMVLSGVLGAGPGKGINSQLYNDTTDIFAFVSWHWFVDNVVPKLVEWTEED